MCTTTNRTFPLAALILFTVFLSTAAYGTTFVVSSTADSGSGSLRQAIISANGNFGADTIEFAIAGAGVQTITPLTPLPDIADPVTIDGYTQPGASANTLATGTDAVLLVELTGTSAPATGLRFVSGSTGSVVRGLIINRFAVGILLKQTIDIAIEGNYIGTDAAGVSDLGNTSSGIYVLDGALNTAIGGGTPAARNVISGNLYDISVSGDATNNTVIRGNYIGLNAAGTATLTSGVGIAVSGTTFTTIGGAGAEGNFIAGHTQSTGRGILIENAATSASVLGNKIGVLADGTTLAPNGTGIAVWGGQAGAPSFITIGSSAVPNMIANNLSSGVSLRTVYNNAPGNVSIRSNSIHDNGGLAIDLGDNGPTGNDSLDTDVGPNKLQNYPAITSANALGGNITVYGGLYSAPSQTFLVQFFHNDACDATNFGEAQTFLGEISVTTNASGAALFAVAFASPETSGGVSALAVDAAGNTSELSLCKPVNVVAQPAVFIGDVSVVEGNAGTATITFPLFLTATPPAGATVDYATANNDASTIDNDYNAASGTVAFAPNETNQTLTVQVNGDANVEPDENFWVNLTSPVNATLGNTFAAGFIIADDAMPSVTISDATAVEGDSGTTTITFTVTVTPTPAFDVTVKYVTAPISAASPGDYVAEAGTIVIPAGSTTASITIDVNGDNIHEQDESFSVILYTSANATLGDTEALGTIEDDDTIPSISIGDASKNEGNAGPSFLAFNVSLSNASYQNVLVTVSTADDSATAGSDYAASSFIVDIPAGQTSYTVSFSILGDTSIEPDETFFVNLSSPSNGTIGDGQGVGTIVDDDSGVPSLTVADIAIAEGNAGTSIATFTLMLSSPPTAPASVAFATANGDAIAGSDYVAASGTANFAIGQLSATVNVTIIGDTDIEPDQTFLLNLSAPSGLTIGDTQALASILNDDSASVDLAITKSAPNEVPAGSPLTYTITVTNKGTSTATTVVVTDVLPPEVTFVSASPICVGTSTVACTIGALAPGASETVTITVTAPNTVGASITNTAAVSGDQTDPDRSDNDGTAIVSTAAASPNDIPTASEWGLLSLVLALAAFAMTRMRT